MKKLMVAILAVTMIVSLFAACGENDTAKTEEPATEAITTETPSESTEPATEAPTEAPTEASGPRIVEAGTLNKHDNGWYQNLDNNTDGVYFNLWSNDVPADDKWEVRYSATGEDNFAIIRDGETITNVTCQVLKYSNTEYFLVCDPWLLGENSPLRANDVLVLQGDFVNYDNGWGLHFETTYITLKGENIARFSTNPPE